MSIGPRMSENTVSAKGCEIYGLKGLDNVIWKPPSIASGT